MTTETHTQMVERHKRETRIAKEQHEIRMRTMQERHFSERMQLADPEETNTRKGQ